MLPPISIAVPYYVIFTTYNLVGTHLGLIITYIAALIPMNVWFLIGIFSSLPIEIERAARVDGCGRMKTFFLIVSRTAASGIVATGLLAFSTCWNEFAFAQLLNAGSPAQTLQSSISGLFTHFVLYALCGAAVTLSVIPSVALSVMLGKYITQIRGLGSMTIKEII
jgi:multiple sugar transport system permease protein